MPAAACRLLCPQRLLIHHPLLEGHLVRSGACEQQRDMDRMRDVGDRVPFTRLPLMGLEGHAQGALDRGVEERRIQGQICTPRGFRKMKPTTIEASTNATSTPKGPESGSQPRSLSG